MTSPLSASHSAVLSSTSVTTSVVSSPGRGRHECPRKLRLRLRWYSSSTAPPTNTHARNASTEPRIALTYLVALPLPSPPGRAATSSGTAASTMPSAARYEARTASGVPALSRKAAASAANAAVTVAWPAPSASLLPFVTRARMSSSPRRMRSSLAAFGCSSMSLEACSHSTVASPSYPRLVHSSITSALVLKWDVRNGPAYVSSSSSKERASDSASAW
mmetsp:Transcript_9843/g.29758  ORF Transcript_9843/g.29758 Transcript_9843/m.29758 type:complete len:219 (+) Transcript_9843:970-1626(+)